MPTDKPALIIPPPLVTNDLAVVIVGTSAFAIAFVVALLRHSWLAQRHATWWIWVTVAGIVIGLTYGPYALWKRRSFLRESGLDSRPAEGAS